MESTQKIDQRKIFFPIFIGILVFIILYILMIGLYNREGNAGEAKIFGEKMSASNPDHIVILAKVITIDPIKGEMAVRLQFDPQGAISDENSNTLTETIALDLNSATGKSEYFFKKGERMNPLDIIVNLYDGYVMDYPLDEHTADLLVGLSAVTGQEGQPKEYTPIPFKINLSAALSGYSISAEEWDRVESGYTEITLNFVRSSSVLFFSIFIMALQWLLALAALSVCLTCLFTGRKIEATLFSWMGALLFALVPLRNAMPGVPPMGALTDYLSFFWAEIIVAVSLIIFVITYLSRPAK